MTARPMTREQALAEARRRWGATALAWETPALEHHKCAVSNGASAAWEMIHGSGPTWEAAFADAERREKEAAKPEGGGK